MDFAVPTVFLLIVYWMTGLRPTARAFFENYFTVMFLSLVCRFATYMVAGTVLKGTVERHLYDALEEDHLAPLVNVIAVSWLDMFAIWDWPSCRLLRVNSEAQGPQAAHQQLLALLSCHQQSRPPCKQPLKSSGCPLCVFARLQQYMIPDDCWNCS